MHKKCKIDRITIFCNNLSTQQSPVIWYTLNHNSGPLLCISSGLQQTQINDEVIAAATAAITIGIPDKRSSSRLSSDHTLLEGMCWQR